MKKIYIDGDMLLYRAAFAAEKEIRWDDDIFTVHSDFSDLKDSFIMVTDCICEILDAYEDNGDEITMVFSDRYTFRHEINLQYKAHRRDKRSPLASVTSGIGLVMSGRLLRWTAWKPTMS